MTITLKYTDGRQLGRQFKEKVFSFDERRIKAIQAAAKRVADEIEYAGKADIRAGGDFGSDRWQDGFHAKVSYQSRQDLSIRITHDVFYWVVFEEGRIIRGNPLLWIPLSFATDAQGISARDYPGNLFRIDRPGKAPLLMASGGYGGKAEAKYFGKESVTIPKKWHLREITRTISRKIGSYYREAFRNGQ